MRPIKLSEAAKRLGITKKTLYVWKKDGKIDFIRIGGLNFLDYNTFCDLAHIKQQKEEKIVIYARTSSSANKEMLENQANRLQQYCIAKGYQIHKIIKEFGSGINDNRPLLTKLLSSGDFTKIVVEHKDRLTRIGFNYIETLIKKDGKEIEVVNNAEDDKENIIQDFVSIITSYCARIYGNRRSKRKTEQLIKELENKN